MSMQRAQTNRKPYAIAMLVVIAWFIITGIFGPLFGKLTSVQENNNSSFLPKGAEATLAANEIKNFSSQDSFNFPALILFEGSFTPATLAAVSEHVVKVGELTLAGTSAKISDYLAPGQEISVFPSQDGKALLANIPLDGNAISKLLPNDEPVLPATIEALREDIKPIAQANGFTPYVTHNPCRCRRNSHSCLPFPDTLDNSSAFIALRALNRGRNCLSIGKERHH